MMRILYILYSKDKPLAAYVHEQEAKLACTEDYKIEKVHVHNNCIYVFDPFLPSEFVSVNMIQNRLTVQLTHKHIICETKSKAKWLLNDLLKHKLIADTTYTELWNKVISEED